MNYDKKNTFLLTTNGNLYDFMNYHINSPYRVQFVISLRFCLQNVVSHFSNVNAQMERLLRDFTVEINNKYSKLHRD